MSYLPREVPPRSCPHPVSSLENKAWPGRGGIVMLQFPSAPWAWAQGQWGGSGCQVMVSVPELFAARTPGGSG